MFLGIAIGILAAILATCFIAGLSLKADETPEPQTKRGTPPPDQVWEETIAATGKEYFTPPLIDGRVYRLDLTGTFTAEYVGVFSSHFREADAAFQTGGPGNFTQPCNSVFVNDVPAQRLDSWRGDRCTHEYSGLLEGRGERVAIAVRPPAGGRYRSGAIGVTLHILPVASMTARQKSEQAKAAPIVVAPPRRPGLDFDLPACGSQIRSAVLLSGTVYEMTFSGVYDYADGWLKRKADAVYHTNSSANDVFAIPHELLTIDGTAVRKQDSWREDRQRHVYTCLFEGKGKTVAFTLRSPSGAAVADGIAISIKSQPVGTKTARMLEEDAVNAAAEAKATETSRLAQQALLKRVTDMKLDVAHQKNMFEAKFRSEFVRQYQRQILSEYRDFWFAEYDAIITDKELEAELKKSAPEVIRFHRLRVEMIHQAERNALTPEPLPEPAPRKLTVSTVPYVSEAIRDLFMFTKQYDHERKQLAGDHNHAAHRPVLERAHRAMNFYYSELARFGIFATTPEEAELQFDRLCPPPVPALYLKVIERIRGGEMVSPDVLCEHLDELYREVIILQAKRRAAVRESETGQRRDIDRRLIEVRQESVEIKSFLDSIECKFQLKDPRERERESTIEDQIIALHESKKRVINYLVKEGEDESVENVQALFAEQQAKLFDDTASYT